MRTIKNNPRFYYSAPKRPFIRKLGTIACDIVEVTPFVWQGRLYRLEYFRAGEQNESNPTDETYFRIIDVYDRSVVSTLGHGCHLGCAFADGDKVFSVGAKGKWGSDTLTIFSSDDMHEWDSTEFRLPGLNCYNTGVCKKKDGGYLMLIEVAQPSPFTFRFAVSDDMKKWDLLPEEYVFQKDRYCGGPAIYSFDGDPQYYVLYLEEYPGPGYATCAARSRDLINWEYSPINPVLMYDEHKDKQIADKFLTRDQRARIERALDINNSDVELCEFLGRTVIYYSWGNQKGIEFLAEASYEGGARELLASFFE